MQEKLNAIWVLLSSCLGDIDVVASIVVHRGTEITKFYSMGCPRSSHSRITLGDGIGTSGGIICVPDGYLCTLCWKFAGSFPSSYPMTLGFGGVIYLVCPGCSVLVITAAYCSACCCGGSAVLFPSSSALVYILDSFSIATNWGFPMFGNGAWGAWFFKAWANYRAAMVAFSVEYL